MTSKLFTPALLIFLVSGCFPDQQRAFKATANPGEVLFCMWNAENFFDNQDNHRHNEPDKEYDHWFATNPRDFQLKLENLTSVLLSMNGRKGPDILALAEVEEESRAPELLMQALNRKLPSELAYQHLAFKNPHGGRSIATCVISRLPIEANRVRLLGSRLRILEVPIKVNNKELIVFATHWTSKLTDKDGHGRSKYADQVHGEYVAMARRNPDIDVLVCGDFNATPDEDCVVNHMKTQPTREDTIIASRKIQASSGNQQWLNYPLMNLFADYKQKKAGTIYYHGKLDLYDQILVSPGMLDDKGWTCLTETAAVFNQSPPADSKGRPWRFGSPKDHKGQRGYSDHFPVTVRLKISDN